MTRLQTTWGSTSPQLFVSLSLFRVLFPSHFQPTLFSRQTPLVVSLVIIIIIIIIIIIYIYSWYNVVKN